MTKKDYIRLAMFFYDTMPDLRGELTVDDYALKKSQWYAMVNLFLKREKEINKSFDEKKFREICMVGCSK